MANRATEKALRVLQRLMRAPASDDGLDRFAMMRVIPEDLRIEHGVGDDAASLYLGPDEKQALDVAAIAVSRDLRFEHLDKKADDAVWYLACEAYLVRTSDRVPDSSSATPWRSFA